MFAKCKQEIKSFWKFELPFIDFFISVLLVIFITKITCYIFDVTNKILIVLIYLLFLGFILFLMGIESKENEAKRHQQRY
jgi:Ca2+/Na+ antiporter